MNTKKTIFLYFLIFAILTLIIWLSFERIALYFELHSPFPKKWMIFNLSDGELLIAHLAGINKNVFRLVDVYKLEQFKKVSADQNSQNITSNNFGLNTEVASNDSKLVATKKASTIFVNREAILYWEPADYSFEITRYLK